MQPHEIAAKFDEMADRLQKEIRHKQRPLTQNPTPKRMKEYRSRLHEAANLERAQRALRALAVAHRTATVPACLVALRTKDAIATLVRKGLLGGGYYDVIEDPQYADTSEAGRALQAMIDNPEADSQRQAAAELARLEDEVRFANIPGFFPTPESVIEQMLTLAEIEDGMSVLEPSAGNGAILDVLAQRFPGCPLTFCEIHPKLATICRKKHPEADAHGDFLEFTGGPFQRILMNPPFEKSQDVEHVRKAYSHLAPGGRLVAIVSAGVFFRSGQKERDFRDWLLATAAHTEELPAGAFAGNDAFRRTAVKAYLVSIQKPDGEELAGLPAAKHHPADATPEIASQAASHAPKATEEPHPFLTACERHEAATAPRDPATPRGNILVRWKPDRLESIVGQPHVTASLAAWVADPCPIAFVFAGPSGVGKTAAAWALANELGCDPDWGGVVEIPSGKQDGRAVDELLRSLHLRPMFGSAWKVAIINEADRMTDQAEAVWLDGLEHLPSRSVVIFTTNNLRRLSERFRRRCEVYEFDGSSDTFRSAMETLVRRVWEKETGQHLPALPEGLGKFELADNTYSIGLALQQIAPYARTRQPLPERFSIPLVRQEPVTKATRGHNAARAVQESEGRLHTSACGS